MRELSVSSLIADSGSTKTDWALLRKGSEPVLFSGRGYNPNFVSPDEFRDDVLHALPEGVRREDIEEIHFYGSGVREQDGGAVRKMLSGMFPAAGTVFVSSDLLGAARALLGHAPGFAAILGTGANSCLYDGEKIVARVPSLGFILGDEGSGAYIGRMLLRDYARENMPVEVRREFGALVGTDADGIIERVYRGARANSYCAQFSRWAGENRNRQPYCRDIIRTAFSDFFNNIVALYPDCRRYSFNCAGSVAYANSDLLSEVASEQGMETGKIIKSPLQGLIDYHSQR